MSQRGKSFERLNAGSHICHLLGTQCNQLPKLEAIMSVYACIQGWNIALSGLMPYKMAHFDLHTSWFGVRGVGWLVFPASVRNLRHNRDSRRNQCMSGNHALVCGCGLSWPWLIMGCCKFPGSIFFKFCLFKFELA